MLIVKILFFVITLQLFVHTLFEHDLKKYIYTVQKEMFDMMYSHMPAILLYQQSPFNICWFL